MSNITLTIYSGIEGAAIHNAVPYDLSFSWGLTGCESMTARIAMSQTDAMRLVASSGLLHCVVSALGNEIWSGRAEDVSMIDDGVQIVAHGYWRNLSDTPYTALWSDRELSNWELVNSDNLANRQPERYVTDNDNRLWGSLKKDTTFANNSSVLEWSYEIPSGSSRDINALSFNYSLTLPSGWRGRIDTYTSAFGSGTTVNTFKSSASGSNETGSVDITFTAAERVNIVIFNNAGSDYANTSQDGVWFFKATGIRVRTTTVASVYIDDIAEDILTTATQLDTTSLISANTMDLNNAIFEDEYPADILSRLAALGDNSGNRWEVGVNEHRKLYYRRVGTTAREWQADLLDIDFGRSVSEMWNAIYAVYKDENGRAVRGATSTNTQSAGLFGMTRTAALSVDTTNSTQANYHRDAMLNDRKFPQIKTALRISPAGWSELWAVRAGDYIRLRNIPPMFDNYGDVTRFRIARSEYNATNDTLSLETEYPGASLDFIIAREAAGVQRRMSERIRRH